MKKIIVAGASTFGVGNMGDDSMLKTLTTELHRNIDCDITFLARHPSESYDQQFKIRSIKNYEHDSREESVDRWFYGFNPGDSRDHLRGIIEELQAADLLVIGGNAFMEISENSILRGVSSYCVLLATLAICFDCPYVLYGLAGHPLELEVTRQAARFLCNNASFVGVREQFYFDELVNAGVDNECLQVFADPAFGLREIGDMDIALEVLTRESILLEKRPTIGVALRSMYWKWTDQQTNHFLEKAAFLCDEIIRTFDGQVLFIPNCNYRLAHPMQDDRVVAKLISEQMANKRRFYCPDNELTLLETLSLYHIVDLLWSNRRHSNIFAALAGRPFLAMSTEHDWHFQPFLDVLDIDLPLLRFDVDSAEDILKAIEDLWKRREEVGNALGSRIPVIQATARDQVRLISDLIR
jgi:polysaccharide pyruvyl transferase WcaK-like protein